MNRKEIRESNPQKITLETLPSFFPRIVREFNDGPDEEPMIYGGRYD